MGDAIKVGAVAYDAKVVPIWEGIRHYFRRRGIETDYVLSPQKSSREPGAASRGSKI